MTTASESGTRGPGGDQRLESILEIATELFFRRGYRGVSIRDLAEAVGVKMSSLYYYFPSKEDILYRIIRRHIDTLLEVTGAALAGLDPGASAAMRAQALIRCSVEQLLADRRAAGVSASQARELNPDQMATINESLTIYEGMFLEIIRDGIAAGDFVETDPAIASYVILGTLTRLTTWFRPNGRLSAEEVAELYSAILVRGLVVDANLLAG